jgi:AraC-like DNA-binding protein
MYQPPQEHAAVWYADDLDGLEVFQATYVTHRFAPHAHPTFGIGLIDGGAGAFHVRTERHIAFAQTIFVLHPEEIHDGSAATPAGWSYRMLYPTRESVQQVLDEYYGQRTAPLFLRHPTSADPLLVQRFAALHRALAQPDDRIARETLWRQAVIALAQRVGIEPLATLPVPKEPRAVQIVRDYLVAHATESPSLHELARLVDLHPSYLVRCFHQAVGLPPHAYLIQLRVRLARQLLREGMPPAAVAVHLGFADQSHLTRHFRRIVGLTPARYARMSTMF